MSEVIPEGWTRNELTKYCDVVGGGTPDRSVKEYWNGDIPWISPTEVTSNTTRFVSRTREKITQLGLERSSAKLHPSGSLLMTSRASIGYVAMNTVPMATNQGFQTLRCKQGTLAEYLYYYIDSIRPELERISAGSTFSEIPSSSVKKLEITLPPLPEQQKIATILSSVDDVIEKTRAQIDKLKDLKTGMMQELLTQGIGHTEFKDSPVGRIPASWQIASLGELATLVTSGSRGWAEYYSESGPIFIRIGNLTREHINLRFEDTIHVTPPDTAEGKRTRLQQGDVLVSITADLGIIGVVNDSLGEAYVNQHIALVRLEEPKLSRWIGHFLSLGSTQKQFIENNDAGAKAGLNLPSIRKIAVALPSQHEQEKIVDSLDNLDKAIATNGRKLGQALHLKKALMQDLLTGKVRVKLNSPEVAAA